jgi:glycosyltransferase involved in cell wall biosynthesis
MTTEVRPQPSVLGGLRICLLTGTLQPGGAERQLFYTAQALRRNGAKVRILSLTRGDYWEDNLEQSGLPVTWVGQSSSRLGRLMRMVREVRRSGADVIQCQHFYTNLYGALAARLMGIREIGAVRNNVLSEQASTSRLVGSLNMRLPRMLAANSQAAIRTLLEFGVSPGRTFFLPNVVDTDKFFPRAQTARDRVAPVRLLAVGRLTPQKRFDRFIELVAQVRCKSGLPVTGVIVGSGRQDCDLKPVLEEQAARLGLFPGHLEFINVASSAMESVYHNADIMILTSDHEGTPNVILEAMASGLPVVATNVGGVPEIVQPGCTGYLVGSDELDRMVDYTLQLVGDREHRLLLGRQARTYIEANHSLSVLPIYLAELYAQVLGRRLNLGPAPSIVLAEGKS